MKAVCFSMQDLVSCASSSYATPPQLNSTPLREPRVFCWLSDDSIVTLEYRDPPREANRGPTDP